MEVAAIAMEAAVAITVAEATAGNKRAGANALALRDFHINIVIGNPYAILFTARVMRETFLAEVFL